MIYGMYTPKRMEINIISFNGKKKWEGGLLAVLLVI